jgi:hypothetical protein
MVRKPAVKEALEEALAKTRRMIEHEIRTLLVVDETMPSARASPKPARKGRRSRGRRRQTDPDAFENHPIAALGPTPRYRAMDIIKKEVQSETTSELPIVIYEAEG